MNEMPPRIVSRAPVTPDDLPELRSAATDLALSAGLDDERAAGFAVAVSEVATNSITHAGGTGEITIVQDDATELYAEVTDHGPGMSDIPPALPEPCQGAQEPVYAQWLRVLR